jgi:hypothetical protein
MISPMPAENSAITQGSALLPSPVAGLPVPRVMLIP